MCLGENESNQEEFNRLLTWILPLDFKALSAVGLVLPPKPRLFRACQGGVLLHDWLGRPSPAPPREFPHESEFLRLPQLTRFIPKQILSTNLSSPSAERETFEMAPQKKSKKEANSINSKLALVMKSGKGTVSIPGLALSWRISLTALQSLSATNRL